MTAVLVGDDAEKQQRVEISRLQRQHLAEAGLRLGEPAGLLVRGRGGDFLREIQRRQL
ncbi:MAG TPA: hypothetical protein VFU24_04345 [Burkholderiales bacterium]|nr:hypothetical protein [Burkholderiales bacterium]